MTIEKIETTALWCAAFNASNLLKHKDHCEHLRAEFLKTRSKVASLVGKISEVLPGLTVHDISHLDGIWEVADLIAGENYPLNPLEAFILGGAILLHDSAMCWEAYENGQTGVRKTVEWQDAYAVECDRGSEDDNDSDESRRAAADFSALRSLHAHQATSFATKGWQHPETRETIFLIDDFELRRHVGTLVGKIASSHHWNVDVLSLKLGDQYNAPLGFPSEWQVDPVKIACLLRCADAAHINNSRAPDFLYALTRRQGISRLHWQAQNRMMGPSLDSGDITGETILYTSSSAYTTEVADAWWIAYDAISVVDAEIRSSNLLLKRRGRPETAPPFMVKKVKGANAIDEMTKLLEAQDWVPSSAQIHVSNIESLVKNLGGEKLYGEGIDQTEVVVRELIQNARDAIVARQYLDPEFLGMIEVRIRHIDDESWLIIEDNGIGMSYEVLTGSLLDFGTSFWKTALVQEEFPGLRSTKFKSIGRFGIGFYSIFMIADSVTVVSRKFDKGLDECNSLIFKNGITFRPIVKMGRSNDFSNRTSTQVRIKLKNDIAQKQESMLVRSGRAGVPDLNIAMHDYIAAIVAGLDVSVSFDSPSFPKKTIHKAQIDENLDGARLLNQLSLANYQQNSGECANYISTNHHRLRPIKVDDYTIGIAAISTLINSEALKLGMRAVGGLATSLHGGYAPEFIGYLNYKPRSARRDASDFDISQESINKWYCEQIEILEKSPFGDFERCIVASNACGLSIDPFPIGRLLLIDSGMHVLASYKEVATLAETRPIVIFKSRLMDHAETYHKIVKHDEKILILPLINASYISLEFENGIPKNPNTMIGCLHRAMLANGRTPIWTTSESKYEASFGKMDELVLSAGASI